MISSSILEKIGLSDNEARVYLALLDIKSGTVSHIAKKSHIHRVTCYDILDYLNKKELVTKIIKNNRIYFAATNPNNLNKWVREKRKKVDEEENFLKNLIPQLAYTYSNNTKKPTVSYFEGTNGVKELLDDVVVSKPNSLSAYTSPRVFERFFDKRYIKSYTQSKIKLRIPHRAFTPRESLKSTIKYINAYYRPIQDIMELKTIDYGAAETTSEITLYDNKMAIINYSDKKHSGVIIESQDLYNIQLAIFNSLWKKTKKVVY